MCHPITAILLQLLLLHLTEGFLIVQKSWQPPQLPSQQQHLHQLSLRSTTAASTTASTTAVNLLPHQPAPFRRYHRLRPILSSGKDNDNGENEEDLFNFFSQTGRSKERSLYLSNLFKSINRVDLLDYYKEYSNKSDFYTDLETRFGVTDNFDKSQIYEALSQYGIHVEKDEPSQNPNASSPSSSEKDNKSFADHNRLAKMTESELINLAKNVPVEEQYELQFDFEKYPFVGRKKETDELQTKITKLLDINRNDKLSKQVFEYATISGAGKTRWMFEAFKKVEAKKTDGSVMGLKVIHINFNVADAGRDSEMLCDPGVAVYKAACRLLLTRGLLKCSPCMRFLTDETVEDKYLPNISVVKDALFQHYFGNGPGLIIVHLDELALLKEKRILHMNEGAYNLKPELIPKVNEWIKNFLGSFVNLSDPEGDQYILPIITHTSPYSEKIVGELTLSKYYFESLRLYPFSLDESWDLINAHRKEKSFHEIKPPEQLNWNSCIALAGGHPSLLLDGFDTTLLSKDQMGFQTTTVGTISQCITKNRRVLFLSGKITQKMAHDFVLDTIENNNVPPDKHADILYHGVAWYLPHRNIVDRGVVSAPFPYLLKLLHRAGGMFEDVAKNIDPDEDEYQPSKAMEYIAALAVLIKMRCTDIWNNQMDIPSGMSIQKIIDSESDFVCVWPAENEAGTDFGGRINKTTAVIGQVKMQEFGKVTKQPLLEIMKFAWFIGSSSLHPTNISSVQAFFISGREAQDDERMPALVKAFRIAMSGQVNKTTAYEEAAKHYKLIDKNPDINDVVSYLAECYTPLEKCKFTYIGSVNNETDSLKKMSSFLPNGVFAGWKA